MTRSMREAYGISCCSYSPVHPWQTFPTHWDFLSLAVVEREQIEWVENQDPLTNNCTKSTSTEGSISVATKIRMLYAGKDLWTAKDRSLLIHSQYSDLPYHSFKQIFPLHRGIFSFYLLFKTVGHKGCSSSCVLLKWNLEVGIKEKKPCPKFPFKSEVWKDIKQSTQCYCCKKVNSASTESKAISSGSITSSPTVNNQKNPRRKSSTWGNGISHCPCSYH